ncbi:MAG: hypothetical protein M1582_00770, partial [Actinobacteria bacterium]|nr:hypothetical protein [Actinomycetota bacterium]
FLGNYSVGPDLKREFQEEAARIYPQITGQWRSRSWVGRLEGRYEPICFFRFLLWKILQLAESRGKRPLICGVTERGSSSEYLRRYVFPRALEMDRDFFNKLFSRDDINSAR